MWSDSFLRPEYVVPELYAVYIVPVTSKYICGSLRSMLKLKLEPFHKQTSLSDPLEVSCH